MTHFFVLFGVSELCPLDGSLLSMYNNGRYDIQNSYAYDNNIDYH